MRNALVIFVTALATTQTFAQDRDTYEGISVNIYGFSKHMNPNTQNPYHSTHPGIGIQKHFGTCFWGTANCFAGIDYIHRNSVGGKVWKVEVGSKWTLLTTSEGYRFHVGGTLEYAHYENPRKNTTYNGFAPVPLIGIGKGPLDFDLSIISRNPLKAITGKDSDAVFLARVNYRF